MSLGPYWKRGKSVGGPDQRESVEGRHVKQVTHNNNSSHKKYI